MILFYTSPGCASCRKVKKWLKDHDLKFIEKNIFTTLLNETEITHSSIFEENGVEKIRVYIERPVEGGFIDATCILPDYS